MIILIVAQITFSKVLCPQAREQTCQHGDIINVRHVINLLQPCICGEGWTLRLIMTTPTTCNYFPQGTNKTPNTALTSYREDCKNDVHSNIEA